MSGKTDKGLGMSKRAYWCPCRACGTLPSRPAGDYLTLRGAAPFDLSSSAQAAITKHHRLGGLWIAEISFSQAWRLEVQDQGRVLVRALFQVVDCWPLLVSSHGREQREETNSHMAESREETNALVALVKSLIPFTMAPSLWSHLILIPSQMPHLLIPSHFGG